MKNNVRSKISNFLTSEEGRVGTKSPLTLGVASAGLLLAQAMIAPTVQAHDLQCNPFDEDACGETKVCKVWCHEFDQQTCVDWRSRCEFP